MGEPKGTREVTFVLVASSLFALLKRAKPTCNLALAIIGYNLGERGPATCLPYLVRVSVALGFGLCYISPDQEEESARASSPLPVVDVTSLVHNREK